jgi:TolB-like protein
MDAKVEPSPSAIRDQVERLRASTSFTGSDRLMALLDYLVGETLVGRGGDLREAVIGNAVYQRDPPYDPRIDSTVRVEARRLRRKLDEHFSADGQYDPVVISIPSGTYAPVFEINAQDRPLSANASSPRNEIFRPGAGTKVAVLPVRVISGDAETKHFADELTDELVFALGSEPGLRVPSRATTFAYADRQPSITTLAAELGLDAVIQGTVRENTGSIRVTIEISDPKGFVASSDRFDSASPDRSDLAERIATTLASRLRFDSSRMRASQVRPGPLAIDYHAKVYRARQLLDRQTPEGLREALQLFKDVAEAVPDYARGHSGVADCYCDMFRIGIIDAATALAQALPAAEQALRIDPQSPEAHTALATVQAWLERDRVAAEASFETALSIGRNARSARVYGSYLALFGMADEAERLFFEARTIEPLSQQQDIAEAISLFQARRFDWLADSHMEVEARNAPAEALFYMALSAHFAGQGAIGDYATPLARARTTHPHLILAFAELQAWRGTTAPATQALQAGNQRASSFAHATLACAVGDPERVFAHLSRALESRELQTVWMRSDVRFDFVRSTPEFAALLNRLDTLRIDRAFSTAD